MKKVLIIFLVSLVISVFTSNITISASEGDIEISEKEEVFFRKELKAQMFQSEGVLVVDTINSHNIETIIVDGVEYEKRVIAYQLLTSETKLERLIEKYSKALEKNKLEKLEKLESKIQQTISVSDLVQYMNDEDIFDLTQILVEIIPDYKIDYDDYTLQIDYDYWDFYVGLYTDFDTVNTTVGIYTRSSEYYKSEKVDFDWWASCPADTEYFSYVEKWNGCEKWKNQHTGNVKNTLNTTLDTFSHQETIEFEYQSYSYLLDMGITPTVDITLINNYWGEQAMIIDDQGSHIGIPFKITQAAHYSRNADYNKFQTAPYGEWVLVEDMFSSQQGYVNFGFELQGTQGSYFHQLDGQTDNTKLTLEMEYYNYNSESLSLGSFEIVLDGNEDAVMDSLTTFSFNFGIEGTYYDADGESIADSHYILDVYPYLIWGNSQADYDNHSAFERFVWDKDSADVFSPISDGYEGQDETGQDLLELYSDQGLCGAPSCIGNAGGTAIPDEITDGDYLFGVNDATAPTFNVYSQTINSGQYQNIDWTNYMYSVADDTHLLVTTIELIDQVNYNVPGKYNVYVKARDVFGNERTKVFEVTVC